LATARPSIGPTSDVGARTDPAVAAKNLTAPPTATTGRVLPRRRPRTSAVLLAAGLALAGGVYLALLVGKSRPSAEPDARVERAAPAARPGGGPGDAPAPSASGRTAIVYPNEHPARDAAPATSAAPTVTPSTSAVSAPATSASSRAAPHRSARTPKNPYPWD
jgi:hypothetical protein